MYFIHYNIYLRNVVGKGEHSPSPPRDLVGSSQRRYNNNNINVAAARKAVVVGNFMGRSGLWDGNTSCCKDVAAVVAVVSSISSERHYIILLCTITNRYRRPIYIYKNKSYTTHITERQIPSNKKQCLYVCNSDSRPIALVFLNFGTHIYNAYRYPHPRRCAPRSKIFKFQTFKMDLLATRERHVMFSC